MQSGDARRRESDNPDREPKRRVKVRMRSDRYESRRRNHLPRWRIGAILLGAAAGGIILGLVLGKLLHQAVKVRRQQNQISEFFASAPPSASMTPGSPDSGN